jgi:hypothetical protein
MLLLLQPVLRTATTAATATARQLGWCVITVCAGASSAIAQQQQHWRGLEFSQ